MQTQNRFITTILWLSLTIACGVRADPASTAPAVEGGSGWRGPFFFIQATDPQFGMFTGNKDFARETELFTQAIAAANKLRPAFVVITGDLIHKTGDAVQIAEFKRIAGQLDPAVPLYLVAGNHDVGNKPTPESLAIYRREFGSDYRSFDFGGCHFVCLDSSVIHTPDAVPDEYDRQIAWLKADLASASTTPGEKAAKHIVVFMHHPPFVAKADEEDSYHSIPQTRRGPLLDLFAAGRVDWVFAGHLHRCAGGQYGALHLVTSGPVGKPLGKDPSGLCIVKVYEDRIEPEYLPLDKVPEKVVLNVEAK